MSRLPADYKTRERAIAALEHNVFLDAGAGCGKTEILARRYLRLLEQGLQPREIVAVTFTNKAAREMKERLRQECAARAARLREAGRFPEAQHWRQLTHALENAPINTIHGFCHSLLRRYALRAGLDPQFVVLDEIAALLLRRETLRASLLQRLDKEEESAARVIQALGLANAIEALDRLIVAREECALDLQSPPTAEMLLTRWERTAEQILELRLRLLTRTQAWREAAQILRSASVNEAAKGLESIRTALVGIIERVEEEDLPPRQRLEVLAQIEGLGNVQGQGELAEACRALKRKDKEPGKKISRLLAGYEQAHSEESMQQQQLAATLTAAIYQEAHHALAAYHAAKAQIAALDFEDLQILARNLLRDNKHVREECRRRYRHLLVDEFQDTNQLQWELLRLLAGAEPEPDALPPPGRLFLVGDAKQSIYRFRGADVTVFDRVRQCFAAKDKDYVVERLSVTFRARPTLVALQNELFAKPQLLGPDHKRRQLYEAFYEPIAGHRQPPERSESAPCCHIVIAESASAKQIQQSREAEAAALAHWLREGLPRLLVYERTPGSEEEKARPAQLGDVAILFRAMSDIAIYEHALRLANLPYHITAGRGLAQRQEIRDFLNLLTALENVQDEIALAGALRAPFFGISDETLFWLKEGGQPLFDALDEAAQGQAAQTLPLNDTERARLRFAWEQIAALRERKNRLPLSSLLDEIIRRTGYTAAVAGLYDGDQQLVNIRRLREIAADFESRGRFSLREFIDYLGALVVQAERMAQAPVVEEQADCLKLMTIHAAKGLEWPIVIVPDLRRGFQGNRRGPRSVAYHRDWGLVASAAISDERESVHQWPLISLLQEIEEAEEEAEQRRLLYVALTRCRDHLVLVTAVSTANEQKKSATSPAAAKTTMPKLCWMRWLQDAMSLDLERGTCALPNVVVEKINVDQLTAAVRSPAPRDEQRASENVCDPLLLQARLRSYAPAPTALRRFTVTGLSAYRRCPFYYWLRYICGYADERIGGFLALAQEALAPTERGDVLHRALELIGRAGAEAIAFALRNALGWRIVPEAEHEKLRHILYWYLRHNLYLQCVASAESLRAEIPVAFPLSLPSSKEAEPAELLIEGKIDAIAERAGALYVLDYKTGYETPEEGAEADHLFQLALYCAGLQRQQRTIEGAYIVYLDRQEIVSVQPEQFAWAWEEAERAIAEIREGAFPRAVGDHCRHCSLRWACGRP